MRATFSLSSENDLFDDSYVMNEAISHVLILLRRRRVLVL